TYKTSDGTNTSATAGTVTINVTPVNIAPVGVNDNYTVKLNTPFNLAAPGVLANDTDANNDGLTAVLVAGSGPTHGSFNLNVDGSFTYTPANGFLGADSFTYRASDGQLTSGLTTVTITVTDTPLAPI